MSTSNCFLVGDYAQLSTPGLPLAEHWNGRRLSIQAVPATGGTGALDGISCLSADDCIAVGQTISADGKAAVPLADRWDGSSRSRGPAASTAACSVSPAPQRPPAPRSA